MLKLERLRKKLYNLDLLDRKLPKGVANSVPFFFNLRWVLKKYLSTESLFIYAKLTAMGILGKADAVLSRSEVEVVKKYIDYTIFPSSKQHQALCLFLIANKHKDKYSKLIKQLAKHAPGNEIDIIIFFDALFEMALIDGDLNIGEIRLLSYTLEQFSFILDSRFRADNLSVYEVLQVYSNMPSDLLKKIIKDKIRLLHGDNVSIIGNSSLLNEYVVLKFTEIKNAYDKLKVLKKV